MNCSKIQNKKAIVLPETLKIIIAVLCILLLTYLAWSLYNIFIVKSKLAQAKETLEQIVAEINGLEEGEERSYLIVAPKGGWYFIKNYKEVCICAEKELLKGVDECCRTGGYLEFKGELIVDSACTFLRERTFGECVSFRNAPLSIKLAKAKSIVSIRTEASLKFSDIFEKLLEFKGNGEKTVKDLCQEYVNERTNPDLREQLENKVGEFFSNREEGIKFQIVETENEKNAVLPSLNLNNGKEIIGNLQDYEFYQNVLDKKLEIKNSEGKSYLIILKIGEWKMPSGSGGVKP